MVRIKFAALAKLFALVIFVVFILPSILNFLGGGSERSSFDYGKNDRGFTAGVNNTDILVSAYTSVVQLGDCFFWSYFNCV